MDTPESSRTARRRRLPVRRVALLATALALVGVGALVPTHAAAASPTCAVGRPRPHSSGAARCTLRIGGEERSYLLSVPPSDRAAPLVVGFHGLFQTARVFDGQTGLVAATRAAGLVLALPESEGPAFNDGRLGASGPKDEAFTMALVDVLVRSHIADPHRVTVVGFSNGAGMAMTMASRHPRSIAALVSIDGSLMGGSGAPRPSGPVRAVLVHGTADRVQPWNGRPARGPLLPAYISVPDTVAAWVDAAGGGSSVQERLPGSLGRGPVEVSTWSPSRGDAQVTAYTIPGMGHVWPVAASDNVDATALVVRAASSVPDSTGTSTPQVDAVAMSRVLLLGR